MAEATDDSVEERDLQNSEERELSEVERMRKQYITIVGQLVINFVALTHSDPHQLLGDTLRDTPIVFVAQQLSPLMIDSDLRLRLTDYGNAEIRLLPCCIIVMYCIIIYNEYIYF